MRNQRGMISVDFIFAFVLVLGFSSILLALSLTLTVAEITQYVTFASARNYYAAHISPREQEAVAIIKYRQLLDHPIFTKLFSGNWFDVESVPKVGNIVQLAMPDFKSNDPSDPNLFIGSGTRFTARMLDFEIPFYGSTNPTGDGTGSGFNTFIGSYLGREVSTVECQQFVEKRWKQIRTLTNTGATPYSAGTSEQGYNAYDDNGC